MAPLGEIVDGGALLNVLWASLAAGLGVTLAASLAILGATRAVDARRDGRSVGASLFALVGLLGVAAVCAAVVLGVLAMASK